MSVKVTIKCRTQLCPKFTPMELRPGRNRVAWTCLECGTVNEYAQVVTIA